MQVDPMTPKLNPPGTEHLKLNIDILLSSLPSKTTCAPTHSWNTINYCSRDSYLHMPGAAAGSDTRPLLSST